MRGVVNGDDSILTNFNQFEQLLSFYVVCVSKKTSFCQNWPWQILLLIMKNPLSFFMTNVCDSFCNSYICIIWLGYIYPTLAKRYLLWLHVEVFGRPLCVTPGLLFEFTLLIVPRAKNFLCKFLIAISLGTLAPGNWAAKSARSPGMKSLVPLLLWNSMARNDR